MAECPEGLYGYNCDKQCSENCGDPNKCNRMTGQCKGGCQAGWTEGRCEKGECLSLNIDMHSWYKSHITLINALKHSSLSQFLDKRIQKVKKI